MKVNNFPYVSLKCIWNNLLIYLTGVCNLLVILQIRSTDTCAILLVTLQIQSTGMYTINCYVSSNGGEVKHMKVQRGADNSFFLANCNSFCSLVVSIHEHCYKWYTMPFDNSYSKQ